MVIHKLLAFLRQALSDYTLTDPQLIDVMRMVNAAIYGFIAIEQAGLMTIERSPDESYEGDVGGIARCDRNDF